MVVGYGGNITGFGGCFLFMPDKGFGVAVMGNSSGVGAVSTAIVRALMDEIIGVAIYERQLWNKPKDKKIPSRRAPVLADVTMGCVGDTMPALAAKNYGKDDGNSAKGISNIPANKKQPEIASKKKSRPIPPQELSLNLYVGTFTNKGYRHLRVPQDLQR